MENVSELLEELEGLNEGELKRVLRAMILAYTGNALPKHEDTYARAVILEELAEGPCRMSTELPRRKTARQLLQQRFYDRCPASFSKTFDYALSDLQARGHVDVTFDKSCTTEIRITAKGLAWLESQRAT